ncbi:MAG: methylenetetrahydrofolate reductase [Bdellovibrionota bacterium]
MITLPFRPDLKLTDVLSKQRFTLSAEVMPPRNGTEQRKVLEQIQGLIQSGAQFLAVTKGAGGSLRGGSLPIAQSIKEQFGVPCIAHFTCRDLSAFDAENQLMDHHYFGIRNILALRGDPPDGQPQWKAREGGYNYAYELIEQIRRMNEGIYLPRAGGPQVDGPAEKTDFCIGAAVYPEHPDEAQRIEFFKAKVDAGAQFAITDMLFDADAYGRFLDLCEKRHIDIPVLPATRLLKNRTQAQKMAAKFRVSIPAETLSALPEKDDADVISRGVELFMKLVERLEKLGAPGIHVYVISDTVGASAALAHLRELEATGRGVRSAARTV